MRKGRPVNPRRSSHPDLWAVLDLLPCTRIRPRPSPCDAPAGDGPMAAIWSLSPVHPGFARFPARGSEGAGRAWVHRRFLLPLSEMRVVRPRVALTAM
jgi:hypothetical protein